MVPFPFINYYGGNILINSFITQVESLIIQTVSPLYDICITMGTIKSILLLFLILNLLIWLFLLACILFHLKVLCHYLMFFIHFLTILLSFLIFFFFHTLLFHTLLFHTLLFHSPFVFVSIVFSDTNFI